MDEPGRGRAGRSTVARNVTQTPDDELWFNTFRIGVGQTFMTMWLLLRMKNL